MAILHDCLKAKDYFRFRLLLGLGHDPNEINSEGEQLLYKVLKSTHKAKVSDELAKLLIESGADVNAVNKKNKKRVLTLAVERSSLTIAELLLEKGAEVNAHENAALCAACSQNNRKMADLLISYGADTDILPCLSQFKIKDVHYPTDIFWVAKWKNATWLNVCLRNGIHDINARNQWGETILFHALHDHQSVEILLQMGADPSIKNEDGKTIFERSRHFHKSRKVLSKFAKSDKEREI